MKQGLKFKGRVEVNGHKPRENSKSVVMWSEVKWSEQKCKSYPDCTRDGGVGSVGSKEAKRQRGKNGVRIG